jgi:hypothetical protein
VRDALAQMRRRAESYCGVAIGTSGVKMIFGEKRTPQLFPLIGAGVTAALLPADLAQGGIDGIMLPR